PRRARVDPSARELTRVGVQSVECDLPAVHVKASYDRHLGASFEFRHCHFARVSRAEPREALFMPSFAGAKRASCGLGRWLLSVVQKQPCRRAPPLLLLARAMRASGREMHKGAGRNLTP